LEEPSKNTPRKTTITISLSALVGIAIMAFVLLIMGTSIVLLAISKSSSSQPTQAAAAVSTATIQPTVVVVVTVAPTAMVQATVAAAAAVATTATEPVQKALIVKGSAGQLKDWNVTVTDITNFGSILEWSDYGNKTLASGNWIVLKLAIKNTGKSTNSLGLQNFNLGLADGTIFKADQSGSAYSEWKGGKRLTDPVPPGVTMTTYAAFDTQPGLRDLIMVFIFDSKNVRLFDASL
jgi:hypothetical protein